MSGRPAAVLHGDPGDPGQDGAAGKWRNKY